MIGGTVSHYRILEKLGAGGMGEVYRAEDTKLKRTVAIKFLPPELTRDPAARERFIQEAQAASALDHPNICAIHQIDETADGRLFLVMNCYQGQTLKDRITRARQALPVPAVSPDTPRGSTELAKPSGAAGLEEADTVTVQLQPAVPLKAAEAVDIVLQIAEGLAAAHKKGILHRDIKPANIFLNEDGRVKILDFGLAKLAGQPGLTRVGTTLGTAAYMSPEQALGKEVDQRTDIWSLGVVLYEMLTGQLPFRGDHDQAVIYSIINENPEPPARLCPDIDLELEGVVNKLLSKSTEARYQEIADVRDDLAAIKGKTMPSDLSERTREGKQKPSIAVLPFANLSADKEQEYFCDGMAEEVINALNHLDGLRVVARTSAFSFRGKQMDIREIGRKLNAATVLEGSVQKSGDRLRITVQLVSVADGYHLWSEKYDRRIEDVFSIQDEISLAIVDKLKVKLLGSEKARLVKHYTADQEAYQLYLKGRFFFNRRYEGKSQKAIEFFSQAIDKDPAFAPAYSGLADSFSILGLYGFMPPSAAFGRAKEVLKKALEIDDSLAETYNSLGFVSMLFDWDWPAAENYYQKAISINPNESITHTWYSVLLGALGRHSQSIAEARRARELEPLSLIANTFEGACFNVAHHQDEAIAQYRRTIEMDPNFPPVYLYLGVAYLEKRMWPEAIEAQKKAVALFHEAPIALAFLGWTYGLAGQQDEALDMLKRLEDIAREKYVSPFYFAIIYISLDDHEAAFKYLDLAYDAKEPFLFLLRKFPAPDSLKSDPRYQSFLRKMKLDP